MEAKDLLIRGLSLVEREIEVLESKEGLTEEESSKLAGFVRLLNTSVSKDLGDARVGQLSDEEIESELKKIARRMKLGRVPKVSAKN